MSRKLVTTVRLDRQDAQALARARRDGQSASSLVWSGAKLGDEAELFRKMAP